MAHCEAGAPLLVRTSNGALCPGAPLVCLEKKLLLMAHRVAGAPLVSFTLMAHHMSGAPLVAIPSIALFLVVYGNSSVIQYCISSSVARAS